MDGIGIPCIATIVVVPIDRNPVQDCLVTRVADEVRILVGILDDIAGKRPAMVDVVHHVVLPGCLAKATSSYPRAVYGDVVRRIRETVERWSHDVWTTPVGACVLVGLKVGIASQETLALVHPTHSKDLRSGCGTAVVPVGLRLLREAYETVASCALTRAGVNHAIGGDDTASMSWPAVLCHERLRVAFILRVVERT